MVPPRQKAQFPKELYSRFWFPVIKSDINANTNHVFPSLFADDLRSVKFSTVEDVGRSQPEINHLSEPPKISPLIDIKISYIMKWRNKNSLNSRRKQTSHSFVNRFPSWKIKLRSWLGWDNEMVAVIYNMAEMLSSVTETPHWRGVGGRVALYVWRLHYHTATAVCYW